MTTETAAQCVWAWLHISDIHVRQGSPAWREDQSIVLDALLRDLSRVRQAGAPAPSAILCTGDIAATGSLVHEDEYDAALDWFMKLREVSGANALFCVPGNHDVQRTKAEARGDLRLLVGVREGRDELDTAYGYEPDRCILVSRFERYQQFAARAGATVGCDAVSAWRVEQEHGGEMIRLVGINTAVLCNDDGDKHKLRTGVRQLRDAFGGMIDHDAITVVLAHHPPDWLADDDRDRLQAHLLSDAELFLHGHIHEPATERRVAGDGRELVTITAGAVHGDRGGDRRHSYSIGGLYRTADRQLLVRVWPRRWVEQNRRFVLDAETVPESRAYAEHLLPLRAPRRLPVPPHAAGVRSLADQLIARLGARRTAFPTDLSIAELHEQGLTIRARLSIGAGADRGPADLVARLAQGASVLALGRPGSGKTVLVHDVALRLSKEGCVPLIVDLAALSTTPATLGDLVDALADEAMPRTAGDDVILLVDGVDEQLAGGATAADVATRLVALAALAPTLVSCRGDDYEQRLAALVPTDLFEMIATLQPWRPELEFADFVERLVEAKVLNEASVIERVEASDQLRRLVERPLLARMLTFVAQGTSNRVLPADATALYESYMSRLGVTTTAALQRLGCRSVTEASRLWREAAWHVHRNRLQADAVPLDALLGRFRHDGIDPECTYRALSAILDVGAYRGSTAAGFVHYSFFEFLVAQYVVEGLTRAHAAADPEAAAVLLDVDLAQEIRRHLTSLLRRTTLDVYAWPAWLARVYRAADGTTEQRQTICNLLAYIACRLDVPATTELRALLENEEDLFLRNSLMWALVRLDDREVLGRYLQELRGNELASLNRGYLLYYFGDIERSAPPYRDDEPFVAWDHTRSRIVARLSDAAAQAATPAARRVIDLYTFCDFAAVRGERLVPEECEVGRRLRRGLDELGLEPEALGVLDDKLRGVGVG